MIMILRILVLLIHSNKIITLLENKVMMFKSYYHMVHSHLQKINLDKIINIIQLSLFKLLLMMVEKVF